MHLVGTTKALSSFKVFDCKDAFNVILGKPWLKAVQAQHDYITDTITIGNEGEQEAITNILETSPNNVTSGINPVMLSNAGEFRQENNEETEQEQEQTPEYGKTAENTLEEQLANEWS